MGVAVLSPPTVAQTVAEGYRSMMLLWSNCLVENGPFESGSHGGSAFHSWVIKYFGFFVSKVFEAHG